MIQVHRLVVVIGKKKRVSTYYAGKWRTVRCDPVAENNMRQPDQVAGGMDTFIFLLYEYQVQQSRYRITHIQTGPF